MSDVPYLADMYVNRNGIKMFLQELISKIQLDGEVYDHRVANEKTCSET